MHLRCFREDSILVILQKIFPLVKWYPIQLSQWLINSFNNLGFNKINNKKEFNSDNSNEVYSLFDTSLKIAKKDIPNNVKIIIFYHPYIQLDKTGKIIKGYEDNDLNNFKRICEKNGCIFVDTTKDMVSLYKAKCILARGFINTKVGYGHLNKYGHEVIAKRLAKEIKNGFK